MKPIKGGKKQTILKLMFLHPNVIQTPHYQVISIVSCIPQKFQVNELHQIEVSHSDMKSNGVGL